MSSFEDGRVASAMVSYAVNALWQAPLIAGVALGASRMLRRVGPRAQHVAWVGALLVMVVLPALPRMHWSHPAGNATATMVADDYDMSNLAPLAPVEQPWWSPQAGVATLPRGLVLALLLGYLAVGVYFAVRLVWSLWRTRMMLREAEPAEFAPEAEAVWERCREAFGLGDVERLVSDDVACPVAVGTATLLVPAGFVEGASDAELLTAMAHECAHLRRRDFWKNVAYELASLPMAFHPALWLVKRQIAESREMVCDGAAVERVVTAQSYVRSLLRLAEGVIGVDPGKQMGSATVMGMFDGRTLERRIVMMKTRRARLGWPGRIMMTSAAAVLAAAVVVGGASMAVAVEAKAAPVVDTPQTQAAATAQSSAETAAQAGAADQAQQKAVQEKASAQQAAMASLPAFAANAALQTNTADLKRRLAEVQHELQATQSQQMTASGTFSDEERQRMVASLKVELDKTQQELAVTQASLDAVRNGQTAEMTAALRAKVDSMQDAQRQAGAAAGYGKMVGTITDPTAALLPGATVTMKSPGTGLALSVRSDASGRYSMDALTAGKYDMSVQSPGFGVWNAGGILIEANQTTRMDARLSVGRVAMETVVTGKAGATPPAAQEAAPRGPQRVSGGIIAGTKIGGDEPVYPPIALAAHVEGSVVLQAVISKDGSVQKMTTVSGPQMLQNAAMEAVRTWRFRPYLLGGEPTEVETTITVVFRLPVAAGASAAVPGTPQRISGGVMAGSKIGGDDLVYPPIAKNAHVQGTVVLHAVISKDGRVEHLEVVSGPQMLQNAAMDAVRTWTYRPYVLNGAPVEVDTTITTVFTMTGGKAPAPDSPQASAQPVKLMWAAETQRLAKQQDGVYRIGNGVSVPQVIHAVQPEFSEEARKAKKDGFEGANVLVKLVVDAHGHPQHVTVIHPVGLGLDEKAVEAVKQYVFKPAMLDGKPVPTELSIEVDFKIF